METPKRGDNPWFLALYISGAGTLLATYIIIGFFISRGLMVMWEGPRYWIAIGTITGLILGTTHMGMLIKKFLGEQNG
jgi:ATP synthase protein I